MTKEAQDSRFAPSVLVRFAQKLNSIFRKKQEPVMKKGIRCEHKWKMRPTQAWNTDGAHHFCVHCGADDFIYWGEDYASLKNAGKIED